MEFQLFKDVKDEYRWRLKSDNGESIAESGEGYRTKASAKQAISLIKKDVQRARLDDQAKAGMAAESIKTQHQEPEAPRHEPFAQTNPQVPAGWYPNPNQANATGFWDGHRWQDIPYSPTPPRRKFPVVALTIATFILGIVIGVGTSGTGEKPLRADTASATTEDEPSSVTSPTPSPSPSPPPSPSPSPSPPPPPPPPPPSPQPNPQRTTAAQRASAPAPPAQPAAPSCHPSYSGVCLKPDSEDYDCGGGSGNGPDYVYEKNFQVVGPDQYDLDRDGDGIGCES